MLSRIHINAFRIELVEGSYADLLSLAAASVEAEAAVGNAIYMLPSFYNHDCGNLLCQHLTRICFLVMGGPDSVFRLKVPRIRENLQL